MGGKQKNLTANTEKKLRNKTMGMGKNLCPECKGRGWIEEECNKEVIKERCPTCKGGGMIQNSLKGYFLII